MSIFLDSAQPDLVRLQSVKRPTGNGQQGQLWSHRAALGSRWGSPLFPNLCSSHQTQQEGADWASSAPEEFTSRGETQINRQLQGRVKQHTGPTSPCKPRPCSPCSESGAEDQSSIRVMDGSGLSSLQPSTPTTDTSFLALQSEAVQHRFPTPIKATAVGSECQRPTVCRCRDPDRDTYWAARSPHSPGDRRGG